MSDRLENIRRTLEKHGQAHVLRFYDELSPERQAGLLDQLESFDYPWLDELIAQYVTSEPQAAIPTDLAPAAYYPRDPGDTYDPAEFRAAGETLIRAGKLAAFTVAGGQGTRLGWNGPKGTYPATVVNGKPLFRVFAEQILANQTKYGITIPWYIMTSPLNDADTRAFFVDNNCFGLDRRNIFMFPQGVMPSLDVTNGRILLAEKHEVATNPDGHGGSMRALHVSGALEDMTGRGIEYISYFQVDNPLASVIDPLFIGLHAGAPDSSGEMSSKMVAKAYAGEKVGVFCQAGGKTMVMEYSDLPESHAVATDADGRLRFIVGSIAIHMISVAFVEKLTADAQHLSLPFHRAVKKSPCIDLETGERVDPAEANAVKLETFVFDALPMAESSIVYETSRMDEFAPIKNAEGVDSPGTSHELQSDRAGKWLEAKGVTVPRGEDGHVHAYIEISPLTALEADDLDSAELPERIQPGEQIDL